jgi:hypothetical protein
MTNTLNQSTRLPRLSKAKFLSILAVVALGVAATFSHADSDRNQPEHNHLIGAWLKPNGDGGLTPVLTTFQTDGTLISSRCIIVPTGPTSAELVSTGHGQWVRTGPDEFMATTVYLRSGIGSGPSVEFTGLVKTVETIIVNRSGDQITRTGTLYIYDADNNLLFPPGPPVATVAGRIIAGQ